MSNEKKSSSRIFPYHCQEMGYCLQQVKIWSSQAGLDFRDFVKNGIDAEALEPFDDEYIRKLIQHVRKKD